MMLRTFGCSLLGSLLGALLAAIVLRATVAVVRLTIEPEMAVEHWVIYLSVVLGAGFGSLSGAVVGLACVVTKSK